MYDSKRIAGGVGVLLALWALVGVLVLSSGVGVAVPITETGGFNVSASYLGADKQTGIPWQSSNEEPTFLIRINKTYARNLELTKTLDANPIGLSGRFRVVLRANEAEIRDTRLIADRIRADTAVTRGLVLDEAYSPGNVSQRFLLYVGPNPEAQTSTNDVIDVGGADEFGQNQWPTGENGLAPGLELGDSTLLPGQYDPGATKVNIRAGSLRSEQVNLEGIQLLVQYDNPSDGTGDWDDGL